MQEQILTIFFFLKKGNRAEGNNQFLSTGIKAVHLGREKQQDANHQSEESRTIQGSGGRTPRRRARLPSWASGGRMGFRPRSAQAAAKDGAWRSGRRPRRRGAPPLGRARPTPAAMPSNPWSGTNFPRSVFQYLKIASMGRNVIWLDSNLNHLCIRV